MELRQATADDWPLVKAIRLEALAREPGVFGGTLADALARDDAAWRVWGIGPSKATFLLFDGDDVVGLTGIVASADDPAAAVCVASYLRSEYRGRGLSRQFYEARIAWARDHGYRRLMTGHRLSNAPSMRANGAFGFVETGRAPHCWPDGSEEEEVFYELRLRDD